MGEIQKKQRIFGLDLARAAAGVFVIGVHFFWNGGFYAAPVSGGSMALACVLRMLFMTCVPLFLLITGYTCIDRTWSKGYYYKLLPILLTYLVTGSACILFRILWRGERFTLREVLRLFTIYEAAPYGWYIGMYIGLFLLSPFFNAAWKAVGEKERKVLTLSLVAMTALPSVPLLGKLLPGWWVNIYPLTYYALGAWLREYPLNLKSWQLLLGWLATAAIGGGKGYLAGAGGLYPTIPEDSWHSWALTLQGVLLFSLLVRVKGEKLPKPLRWCVERVAKLSLAMYLISFIPDDVVYPWLVRTVPEFYLRLRWMPLVVPAVALCACLLARLVEGFCRAITRGLNRLFPKLGLK